LFSSINFYTFAQNNQFYMAKIAIYTLTSELHDEQAVTASTKDFLETLGLEYDFCGANFDDYGTHSLDLLFVRTGGTEGIFHQLLPLLQSKSNQPIYLLTSGKSNSLAASMEILSYMQQNGILGEIIHGSSEYVCHRIKVLQHVCNAKRLLCGTKVGVIGAPSDWLISSNADAQAISTKLGIEIINIPMQELLDIYASQQDGTDVELMSKAPTDAIRESIPGALRIYECLKVLVEKYSLSGLTIRCFDLLTAVRNTGCIALAKLNAEGIVAGCEGDVPAVLSMMVSNALTGKSGFQCNPASVDVVKGRLMFAHCTIPLNMVDRYELDTHFESGIGVGIRGYMHGNVTIFKMSGDASRIYAEEATILSCENKPNLCRTQTIVQLDHVEQARYFLTRPIGNHHIIINGRHKEELEELLLSK
jgi:L-fucose isomerase-like protein